MKVKRHLRNQIFSGLLIILAGMAIAACASNEAPADEPDTAATAETTEAQAQDPFAIPARAAGEVRESPNASVSQVISTTEIRITYGRPGVKGREVFGGLEPYGQVWRAGANEATVFRTTRDVTIDGEPLSAGVYGFFAIPDPNEWTLVFNRQAAQWGAFDYDEEADALRVSAEPESAPHKEWLEYYFENLTDTSATAVLHWGTTRVPFTIAVQ